MASPESLKCNTNDNKVMSFISDCVSSAKANPSVGEKADDHRRSTPTCQGGSVPFFLQAVRRSGLSPESSRHCAGDGGHEQSKRPQIP